VASGSEIRGCDGCNWWKGGHLYSFKDGEDFVDKTSMIVVEKGGYQKKHERNISAWDLRRRGQAETLSSGLVNMTTGQIRKSIIQILRLMLQLHFSL
jgi:hypothetical protein